MLSPDRKPPLVVIVGPTAVGKTSLSIELARRVCGEIVSADSRLFYRGMDIGTAKPTPEERGNVPHHLIDVTTPDQTWSLALFQQAAKQVIAEIHARGRLPMLVGGTGQYVRAVTEAWSVPAQQPLPELRAALEAWAKEVGSDGLHRRLAVVDPAAAAAIDFRNVRRTVRALEVIFSTGERFSEQRTRGEPLYDLLVIGLQRPRGELYARVDERIQAMLDEGLVDEVRRLIEKGYSPDLPTLSAIGYREVAAYLEGKMSLDEAVMLMKRNTRQFVRRQANWFKPDNPGIHWFLVESDTESKIESLVRQYYSDWLPPGCD